VAGKAIDCVVLFCNIGEHATLNTNTMGFNSFRDSNIFVDSLIMLSVTYYTLVSKEYDIEESVAKHVKVNGRGVI
jgi:hypothetical protein